MEKEEARAWLKRNIKKNDTIYCILRRVSRSGTSREISFRVWRGKENSGLDGELLLLDAAISSALGYKLGKEGVITDVVGMDAGFEVVYNLSKELFGDGYALKHKWL